MVPELFAPPVVLLPTLPIAPLVVPDEPVPCVAVAVALAVPLLTLPEVVEVWVAVAEVPPPELPLGPHDRDRQFPVALLVGDRERVLGAGAPARDADERELPADEPVQRRAQHGHDEAVAGAVPDRKRRVARRGVRHVYLSSAQIPLRPASAEG